MKTKLDKNTNHQRFASRTWAVRLSVNGRPVNHTGDDRGATVVNYHPTIGEPNDRAFERFAEAVERAVRSSLCGPVILNIAFLEECLDSVIDALKTLLITGSGIFRPDGSWVRLKPGNLFVNLWLDENHPGTVCVVNRIVG